MASYFEVVTVYKIAGLKSAAGLRLNDHYGLLESELEEYFTGAGPGWSKGRPGRAGPSLGRERAGLKQGRCRAKAGRGRGRAKPATGQVGRTPSRPVQARATRAQPA